MAKLSHLSPNLVWELFEKICSIPHPSKHEQQISAWIQQWSKDLGLSVTEDKVGNLIIRKPATAGMEDRQGVILQAHMDMVPQKNAETQHDFTQDPIDAYVDGEWVTATGTTLGADNGIGLATALAVLASDDVAHGPLEVLVTIDEEAGMTGAFGLEPGMLEGKILLNTDSEQEGEIYMGCAGGINAGSKLAIEREAAPADSLRLRVVLDGLKGGHSGCDIHLGRGNANKLLARVLIDGLGLGFQLSKLQGGTLRNAIPREAFAELAVPAANADALHSHIERFNALLAQELKATEPSLSLRVETIESDEQVFSVASQARILHTLNSVVNGVVRMSDEAKGVVETSSNLGVVETHDDHLGMLCLIRSLTDSGREYVEAMIRSTLALSGAEMETDGAYPGWAPDTSSAIMQVLRDTYTEMFGSTPDIQVIHAGLECGLFKTAYPDWDMVSFGPTIKFPHSPDEKVEIATVERFWELMKATLKAIPAKG